MGMWKTWHHLEREDGSACLYYTLPGQSTHFVVYDTTDGPLKEIAGGYKRRAEAAEAENARLREQVDGLQAEIERLTDGLERAADGEWDAEPSWYARHLLDND